MSVTIREARLEDAASLLRLIKAHAAYEKGEATCSEDQLKTLLDDATQPVQILLANFDEKIVGYAAITIDFSIWRCSCWAHLDCLYIDDGHRGQHIGEKLLDAARQYAREIGADRLEWQTPDWNVDAARFYVRHGADQRMKLRFGYDLK